MDKQIKGSKLTDFLSPGEELDVTLQPETITVVTIDLRLRSETFTDLDLYFITVLLSQIHMVITLLCAFGVHSHSGATDSMPMTPPSLSDPALSSSLLPFTDR